MPGFKPDRRLVLSFGALALVAPAAACAQPRYRPGGACVGGQPEITPLEPLEIATDRGRARLMVELADSDAERASGLMCRKAMAPDRGMLFDFRREQEVAFWMRNTLIPLDMVFIRADGSILSIARNTRPLDDSPVPAGGPVRFVLEIAGGRAAQLGVLPGDKVSHRLIQAQRRP